MKPVLLWTDISLWLVVAAVVFYGIRVAKNDLLRGTWARVFNDGPAVASAVLLLFAIFIALLDSLHYRPVVSTPDAKEVVYAPQVKSVLDLLLADMAQAKEKSYSAPFAIYALNKENLEVDGKPVRTYPRLKFAGKHLKTEQQRLPDIAFRAITGAALGGVFGGLIFLLWVNSLKTFNVQVPATAKTWGFFSMLLLGVLSGAVYQVSEAYHVLGTDKVGVDVLYSAIKSLRTAVVLGLLTTLVTLPLGIFAGLAAGYFKGFTDDVIQYVYTTLNSIPGVLLIAAAVLMLQVSLDSNPQVFETAAEKSDLRLFFLCVILGVTSWTGLARLLRGETLKLRELEYVQAARAFGASHRQVITQHLLPNVMHIVLIMLVMDFSGLVLAEAVLSYVGVGVDPSTQSYGTMINAARLELSREPVVWWTLAAAFSFMLVLVLAANLFSDAVRDAFDPRARQLKKSLLRV